MWHDLPRYFFSLRTPCGTEHISKSTAILSPSLIIYEFRQSVQSRDFQHEKIKRCVFAKFFSIRLDGARLADILCGPFVKEPQFNYGTSL